ncbi:MAG: hypothetical protein AAFR81_21875 [Chloroflexota bacterium]
MGRRTSWVQKDRVLLIHFWGELTTVDIQEENNFALKLVEASSSDIVHVIVDVSQVTEHPRYFSRLLRSFSVYQEAKLGYITTITKDNLLRFMLTGVSAVGRSRRAYNFRTLANAVRFLQMRDVEISTTLYDDCLRYINPVQERGTD